MKVHDMFVEALGVYLPEFVSAEEAVASGRYDPADYAENGLAGALVAGELSAPEMAVLAARSAFARSGLDPAGIDVVMHASGSPQGPEVWSQAAYIQRQVVCSDVPAMEVRLGCNGLFAALELATCYLRAEPHRRAALLTTAENMESPLGDRWRVTPGLIGSDAGCALVLGKTPGFARLLSVESVTVPELEGLHRGAEPLFPAGALSGRTVDMRARGIYFREHEMGLAEAFAKAEKVHDELIARVLADAGVEFSAITKIAYINAARYMVEQRVLLPLGIDISRTTWHIGRRIGHTGPGDQFICVDYMLSSRELSPGDHVLMLGAAPGFSLSSAVVEIVERPAWA